MENKTKVLFVVSEFYQSGANRNAYEIDQAINKDLIQLDILSWHPLNNSSVWEDFYYQKHKDLGTEIYFLDEVDQVTHPTLKQRIDFKLFNRALPNERLVYQNFMDEYDKIIVIGEYLYPPVQRWMTGIQISKTFVAIQNSIFQHPENYANFNKDDEYKFISCFEEGMFQNEFKEFKNYTHCYFPLSINLANTIFKSDYTLTQPIKIGIFTRLSHTKPLDPFLYALQSICERYPSAQLHIYGNGDPIKEGVMRIVKQLDLKDNVFFRGHQDDLINSALDDNLNLIWLHGYYGMPGGFAGFDICTTKIPQVFWDFSVSSDKFNDERFPMYHVLSKFVTKSLEVIENESVAKDLAGVQYEYIENEKDIKKFIHILEDLLMNKA